MAEVPLLTGVYWICGSRAYWTLPPQWKGICSLGFVLPDVSLGCENASLPFPLRGQGHLSKRAGPLTPLIALIGILSVMGAVGGDTLLGIHHHLSQKTAESLTKTGETPAAVQEQLDSLAGVALQNQRAVDLLPASAGGTCLYFKEECCLYVNKSGQVQQNIQSILDSPSRTKSSTYFGIQIHGPCFYFCFLQHQN